jgi:hypothetical protein
MRDVSIREGFDADVVSWLLPDPPSEYAAGATRNVILLATAGARILTLDDDVVCAVRAHPEHQEGVAFFGHTEPRDTIWYASRSASLAGGVSLDLDLISAHSTYLGAQLRDLGANEYGSDLSHACQHLLRVLRDPKENAVVATWAGVAGDSAAYCPYRLLFDTGPTRDAMTRDPKQFHLATTSREVLRVARRATMTDESSLRTC